MSTQRHGVIRTWKDDKGFGFITPEGGGPDVFVHASSFAARGTRPSANVVVRYSLSHDEHQRPRAINVRFANTPNRLITFSLCVASLFFVILFLATYILHLPRAMVVLYILSSGLAYWLYARDKASAIKGSQRVPEKTLHFVELVGGWPGALVAQETYHHKTIKSSYQAQFWMIVFCNLLLLIGYIWIYIGSIRYA